MIESKKNKHVWQISLHELKSKAVQLGTPTWATDGYPNSHEVLYLHPSSIYIEPFPSISSKCQLDLTWFYKLTILIWIALRRRLRTCKWDPFTLASWAISMAVLPSPLPSSGSAPSSSNMRKVSSSPETQTLSKRRCRQYWWFVDVSPFTRGYFQVPC